MPFNDSTVLIESRRPLKTCFFLCFPLYFVGLRCSSGYLKQHNLVEVLTDAHKTLVHELALTDKWAVNDQQVNSSYFKTTLVLKTAK